MENHSTFNTASLLKSIKETLKERYISFWQKRIKTDEGKLRTYKLFKQNFGLELYLDIIHDISMKRNICSFRISAHRLQIERGRHTGTNIDERLCNHCNAVEDETNFLFECKKYEDISKDMFKTIIYTKCVLGKA